ncbi:MAG: CNNM domain-containing protein [Opitutales bacterium]
MIVLLSAVGVALVISFSCSILEAALLSISSGKIALISKKKPKIGKVCEELKGDIEKPIAVILILNTTAHTFGAAIAGAQFDKSFGSEHIWLFSLVFTVFMVQFTEILPKTLGVRFNSPVIAMSARFLKVAVKMIYPIIWLIHLLNRPFESKAKKSESSSSETLEEMNALATKARKSKYISAKQEYAMHEIPELQDDLISDIMLPIKDAICLDAQMSKSQVIEEIKKGVHSRYPVRKKRGSNEFIGFLNARDLLFCEDDNWQSCIKEISIIKASEKQLLIAENIKYYDSKLLLLSNQSDEIIGILSVSNLFNKLFP